MAEIYFRINADFEKVQLLRTKIDELTEKLKNMDQATDPKGFRKLEKQLQTTTKEFNSLVSQAAIAGAQLKKANQDAGDSTKGFGDLNSILMKIGGTAALTKLGSDIVQVRGEFQQLEIAFTTLLGSKEKSDALMNQMVDTAMKTPYSLQGVASGARQLLAYGFAAENVNDVLVRLGNVASGLGLPLERLTYLYGTTRVQGRLYARDMLQFTSSGIPLLQKLADMYGVSTDKINDMVTAGKIGFSDVEKVFKSMTDQGGMFYNLMENQSKSFTGQISNIKDQISKALNDIGKSNEDIINGSLGGVKMLIDNYETVGKVLVGLIATYGTYKTAVIVCNVIEGISAQIKLESALAGTALTTSQGFAAIATKGLSAATLALNKTMLANPYVAIAVSIGAVCTALWVMDDGLTTAERAQKNFNDSMEAQKQHLDSLEDKAKNYINTIKSETATHYDRQKALNELQKMMPSIFKNMDMETLKVMSQTKAYQMLAEWKNHSAKIGVKTNIVIEGNEVSKYNRLLKEATDEGAIRIYQKQLDYHKDLLTIYQNEDKQMNKISKQSVKATPLQSVSKETDKAAKNIQRLNKEIANLRSGKTKSTNYEEDIKSKTEELETWKKSLSTLTGISPKDQKAANKAKEEANKEKVAADERTAKIAENNKKIAEIETQAELDRTQSKIDLMDEGFQKQQAQIDLNFRKQIADAKKKTEELIKVQNETKKLEFENKNPDWKKKGLSYTPITSVSELPKDQQDTAKSYFTVANDTMLKATNDLIENLLKKHQDYNAKKVELEKQYNDDIEALTLERARAESKGDAETVAKLTSAIAQAKVNKGKSLMSLSFEHLKESPDYARAFEDLNNTSTETLSSLLSQLQEAKGEASKVLNPQDLKEYSDAIQAIIDKLTERDPFKALIDRKSEMVEAGKELAKAQSELNAIRSGGQVLDIKVNDKGLVTNLYLDEKTAIENVNKAKDNYTKKNNELVKTEKLVLDQVTDLSNALKGFGDTIGGSAGQVISLIGDVGSFVATTSSGITKVAATGAQAISTIEKASVILAIISAAIQLMQKLNDLMPSAFKSYEKYAEKIEAINKMTDAVTEYQLAVLKASQEETSWFGGDSLRNLKNFSEVNAKALDAYNNKLKEQQAIYQNKKGGGWLSYISPAYMIGSALGDKYKKDTTEAINNLRIETKKASKGFLGSGIGGKSQKTENLVSWVKSNLGYDLFDSNGWINQSAYDTIMDKYSDKLVGQTKETLEELDKLKKEYDEYQKQLKEYVSNLYEPIVDNMVSGLFDWLDSGKSALDSFKDYAGDTFKKIVTDMMKTIVLKNVVGSFSDDISKLYTAYSSSKGTDEDLKTLSVGVSDKTNELIQKYKEQLPALESLLSTISGNFSNIGIDITKDSSSQDSTSGSFQTMSQDQGRELDGRFTALQMAGEEIKTQNIYQSNILTRMDANVGQLLTISSEAKILISKCTDVAGEIRDLILNSFYELQAIKKNTGETANGVSQSNTYLKKIADKL